MKTRAGRFAFPFGLLVLIVAGCVTINLYFPEKEVKDLAEKIEQEVQQKAEAEGTPSEESTPPKDQAPGRNEPVSGSHAPSGGRGAVGLFDTLLGVTPAYAQQVPEPEVTNPAIRKIIDSRAARLADVNRYKSMGVIGENNKGDLEVRDLGAVSDLRARADVQKLVRAENADRDQLYREIAAAKNIDPSQIDKVRETYAETLRTNARSGDWIQMPDGSWKQKP